MSYDPQTHTKGELTYDYQAIQRRIPEDAWAAYCERLRPRLAALSKSWTPELNVEWIVRHYLAIKTVLGSSLLLGSMEYAADKNVRAAVPYFAYYGLFNAARAWVFTMIQREWGSSGEILTLPHETVYNLAVDQARHIDPELGRWLGDLLEGSRASRELFSYRFPTGGPGSAKPVDPDHVLEAARILAELAQAHSEMLSRALDRALAGQPDPPIINHPMYQSAYFHDVVNGKVSVVDWDDYLRIGQLAAKERRPHDLILMTRAGLIDDFFGAWLPDDDAGEVDTDSFNPDDSARLLLDFP